MKKLILLVSSLFALHVNAQNSISLIHVVGSSTSAVVPNSVIQTTVGAFQNRKVEIDIQNTSTNTNTYTVTRYDVLLNYDPISDTRAEAYYCFAGSCYGTVTIVSPPLILRGGKKASDTTLVDPNALYFAMTTDLDEAGVRGRSLVKYTFKNVAVAADSVQFTIAYNGSLGFNTITKELSSFDVFPNPASDLVELKISSNKFINSKAYVLNALGAVVLEKDLNLNEGKNNVQLDIHTLPAGVYFARVGNSSGYITRKFVVN